MSLAISHTVNYNECTPVMARVNTSYCVLKCALIVENQAHSIVGKGQFFPIITQYKDYVYNKQAAAVLSQPDHYPFRVFWVSPLPIMYNLHLFNEKWIKTAHRLMYFPLSFRDWWSFIWERGGNREEGGQDEKREVWEAERLGGGWG